MNLSPTDLSPTPLCHARRALERALTEAIAGAEGWSSRVEFAASVVDRCAAEARRTRQPHVTRRLTATARDLRHAAGLDNRVATSILREAGVLLDGRREPERAA